RSSTEITMVLATPMPPTSSATAPTPSSRPVNATLTAALAASASEGRDTSASLGCAGVALGASSGRPASARCVCLRALTAVGAAAAGGGRAVDAEVAPGGGPADQGAQVQLRRQRDRIEDADHGEPAAAEPDLTVRPRLADAQTVRRQAAEHDRGIAGGGVVEP